MFSFLSMIGLTTEIAPTVPLPGRKPHWLSLENVSINSTEDLSRNAVQCGGPVVFSYQTVSFFMGGNGQQIRPCDLPTTLALLISLRNICSMACPAFFITSAMILSSPGAFLVLSSPTSDWFINQINNLIVYKSN